MRAIAVVVSLAATFLLATISPRLLATISPRAAEPQNDYPARPVSLIVPYAAGGVADVAMRLLGDKLSGRLGQQFIIENRPGAGGIVAAQATAAAPGDGYTLLMTGNNTAIAATLFKSLPYNVLTDFASISTAAFFDLLLVTRSGSPLHAVADVIATARANPGKLNIGTINPGSTQNLAAELFTSTADIKAAIVPFRTSPDMAGALLRGDIDLAFEFYAAVSGMLGRQQARGARFGRSGPDGLSAAGADRDRKRPQRLRGDKLERPIRSSRNAGADRRNTQPSHERNDAVARSANTVGGNGHGDALEHAAGDDRANASRYPQMVRGDRKGRDCQTRLRVRD